MGHVISDFVIAVNRTPRRSDYIPCITWEGIARFSESLELGDYIHAKGWIQSRVYKKQLPDGASEDRTAYEVSLYALELLGGGTAPRRRECGFRRIRPLCLKNSTENFRLHR